MKGRDVIFSKKSDEWGTPDKLFNGLDKLFNFTLDPCATPENAKCKKFYTKEDDGLSQSWRGESVFINPPYSQVGKWIEKAYNEAGMGDAEVVMLLPVRSDARWFHEYVFRNSNEIYFIKGRLRFTRSDFPQPYPAPFPTMVVRFLCSDILPLADYPSFYTMNREGVIPSS